MSFAIALSSPVSARMRHAARTTLRCVMAWLAGMALWCGMAAASAQVVLESADNTTLAGSGPAGNGPDPNPQVVTLRHNTDNPAGNTLVARTPAVTVTYSLVNQQFTGLTAAESFPASTGGNAVFFGGTAYLTGNAPAPDLKYVPMLGSGATANLFSSVAAMTGQGISIENAAVRLTLGTNAIAVRQPSTPTTARVRMADMVLTFSVPVDNPILHINGMGGQGSAPGLPGGGSAVPLGLAAEFDMLTPGVTLTRLSGNSVFAISGNQISNTATRFESQCTGAAGCGSVRVNGTAISTLTLRVFVRGDGYAPTWWELPDSFNADVLRIGVSVMEPTPTVTVRKTSTGGVGTFTFSGTNGYTATSVTTATAGTPVDGAVRTLSAAETVTAITEDTTPGYRLTGITCTGLGTGGTATVSGLAAAGVEGGGTVTLNAAATALRSTIVCTFTNEKLPVIRLRKSLPNGRAVAADQFTLNIGVGATAQQSATTTGSNNTPTQVATLGAAAVGTAYTLWETGANGALLANYDTTYSCTNTRAGGQTPSGSAATFNVTPVAGDDLTCVFSNAARLADIEVVKSAASNPVASGGVITFTLVVTNHGPTAAGGAVLKDTPGAGLDCTTPSTTFTCAATGGATCSSATVPVATLLGTGMTIPTLPSGGQVTATLRCTATATGLP
ncbi:prealbumin-like fold domain-containing protein [Pseudoxanthomonas japonensis]|uniref:prealbumin-like fold domain-containing protein n=1 Tax=Pseudoxanthomonas japonensis TaxID=69284 RepID=UPI00286B8CEA|nr:hypothetical protein [Pseudoxanthomonas japonensis]